MKYTSILKFAILLFLSFLSLSLFAQPENNDCQGAIELFDVANWCSTPAQFTTVGATPSGFEPASCSNAAGDDVWFKFTAIATDVTVTIIGAQRTAAGGTLRSPEVGIYIGDCNGVLNERECQSDQASVNNTELYKGGLIVGAQYLIRVQGNGNTGTFQMCINNYNPPVNPGSDCITASVLCDKSQFVVQQVTGAGNDPDEAGTSSCLGGFADASESNSTWFVWTADPQAGGSLEFTLTPLNPPDDLDFVLYELPDGIGNCFSKSELRCMASGEAESAYPSRCLGPTGLAEGQEDNVEFPGCNDPRQNNFLAPIDMEPGKSYALMINNFSAAGNGFSIGFGGTGEFLGPEADFIADADESVCFGEPVSFQDASSFALGELTKWEWSFGVGATPSNASGKGPHQVTWTSPGIKSVVLQVETDRGCVVTEIETFTVESCCQDENAMSIESEINDLECIDDPTGSISLSVDSNVPPHTFKWENGSTSNAIAGLDIGDYAVTITNAATCDTVISYSVGAPNSIMIDTIIKMATCGGGRDGSIRLEVTGGVGPYYFDWKDGRGFTEADNSRSNLAIGTYEVSVRDANLCQQDLSLDVGELELFLDPAVEPVSRPSCTGFSDGSISITIDNGQAPYEYDWNDGRGRVGAGSLLNISAGNYSVRVFDANDCEGNFEFEVEDYPPVILDPEAIHVSCFGAGDGSATARASGGVGGYSYFWSNGRSDSTITGLVPGNYDITVTDANGCEVDGRVEITEPAELFVEVSDISDVLCHGDPSGSVSLAGSGGNPPYEFSTDGIIFQPGTTITGLFAGTYTFAVRDQLGCTVSVEATVREPSPLEVDAGEDQKIDLGFSTEIAAVVGPAGKAVSYSWSDSTATLSCRDCPDPVATPVQTTIYEITIIDETGCVALDSITVKVVKNRPIYAPNVFSPNEDGLNDYFTLFGGPAAREIITLKVFNRWGGLVYEQDNIPLNEESLGWDGMIGNEKAEAGVYAYYAEIAFIDNVVVMYKGDITIFR